MQRVPKKEVAELEPDRSRLDGVGTKAIALKNSRRITLRDFSIYRAGHFGILATGVDDLTIDNLRIDTNRDGIDLDAVRNVRVSNTVVNAPNDDAIVLKSTLALGYKRATENVTITNTQVSGFDLGTLLDGTYGRTQLLAPDKDGPTGRIKIGTESSGDFRNIAISNCTFTRSRGLAIETVDGGVVEDVVISNITMHEVTTAPLFLRLGNRARGPDGTPVGAMRRISISNVNAYDAESRYASIISGLPGHPVEDVQISNVRLHYRGGGTAQDTQLKPEEHETAYPEPSMFGTVPAYGFYIRHAKNLLLRDIETRYVGTEARAPYVLDDVEGFDADRLIAQKEAKAPFFVLDHVRGFRLRNTPGLEDTGFDAVDKRLLKP